MKLHELKKNIKNKSVKRVGRGISAGGGKTAGRGTKGQKSRAGHNIPRKFEGGQTPLVMRLHKLPGFKSHRPKAKVVNLDDISLAYKNGEKVSEETLVAKGLIGKGDRVKILGKGELKVKVSLDNVSASKSAIEAINKFSAKADLPADASPARNASRSDAGGRPTMQAGKSTTEKSVDKKSE